MTFVGTSKKRSLPNTHPHEFSPNVSDFSLVQLINIFLVVVAKRFLKVHPNDTLKNP